mgnify:CR=1 FL=1
MASDESFIRYKSQEIAHSAISCSISLRKERYAHRLSAYGTGNESFRVLYQELFFQAAECHISGTLCVAVFHDSSAACLAGKGNLYRTSGRASCYKRFKT